ncbi:hypothetical protein TRVL_01521 [Trypanosoma vivax]|nr:hypothetical protein TRVL_01521 [Trypanosoma vivax]
MALLNVIPYETALRRLVHSGICSDEQLCDYTLSQSLRSVAYAVNRASTPIASLSKHCVSSANGIEEDQCASSLRVAGGVSVLCHMCTYSITSHQCQQASIYLSTRLLCDDASAYGEGNERPCCRVAWTDALCSGGTMSYLQRRMEVDRRLALGYLFILAGTMRTVGLGVVNGQRLSSHHADFVQRVLNDVVPRVAVMADTHEGLSRAHCVPPANESKDDSANTMPVAQRSSVFTRPSRLAVEANNAIIHIFHYISGDILSVHHSGEKQSSGCHLVLDRDMPNRLWPAVSVLRSALIRALNWVVQEIVAHIHSAHIANEHREAQATVEVMEGVKSALDAALSRIVKQQEALECSRKRIEQQVGISARDYHATTDMMWANTLRLCIFCKNITGAWIEVQGGIGHTEVLLSDKKVLAFIASLVASVRALEEAETDSQIFYANTALLSAALAAASAAPAPFMQSSLWLADASLTQQMHNAIVHRALRYKDENVQKLGALISQMVLYGSSLSSSTGIVTQSSEQLLELISDGRDAASQCVIRMLSRAVLERPHSLLRSMFHLLQHGDTKTRRNVLDVLSALPQMENDTVYGETISAEQMRPMLHLLAEELLLQIQDEELLVRLEGAKLFAKVWPEDVCRPLLIIALQRDKSFKKQSAARHALQLLLSAHTGSSRVVLLILEESLALLSGVIRTACLTPSTPASILAFSKFHACGSEEDAGDTVKVNVSPRAADPDATSNNNTFSARVIRLALSLFKWWAERVPIWTEACIEPIVRRVLRATTAIEQEFIIRMMAQMSTLCGATVDGASVLVRSCVNLMLCKNDEAQHAALWIEQGPISNPPRSEDGTVMPVVMSGEVKDADRWMYQVLAPLLCLRSCPRRSFACRGVEDMPRAMLDLWDLLWRLLFIPKYRDVLTTDGQRLVLELVCKYSASMILERLSCLEKELMENNRSDALGDSAAWDIRFLCRIGFFCVGSLFSQMRGVFCKNAEKVPPSGGSDEPISESFSVDANYSETELRELLFGVPMVRRWIENTVIPWLLSDNDDSERTPSSFATEMQRLSQSAVDCAALLTLVALNCMEVDTLAISSFMQPLEELAVFYRVQLKHVKKHSAEDESACLSMNYKDLLGKFEFAIHVQKAALNIVRSHPMGRDLICLWFVKYMPQLIELANAACAVSDALKKSDVGLVAVECCHLLFLAVMASGNDKAVVQLQQLPQGTEAGFSSCVLMGLDSGDRSALLSFAVGSARYSCLPHIQSEGVKLLSALLGAAPEMFTDEYTSQSETLQEALAVLNSVALMHTDAKTRSLAVSVLEFIQKGV